MVHLWVEDFLELFTTIMVAYIFVLLGIVSTKTATRVVYLDILLYSFGGVVGTMHHMYFSGTPAIHMALGAFFSAAEIVPLTFLTVEAWTFLQLGAQQQEAGAQFQFPHRWAVMFLVAVGFWNFLGAGVFGFLINLPVVSYYEIGTQLTANHGHAAMMGVYGMLAVSLLVFCLRYYLRPEDWSERCISFSFWASTSGSPGWCLPTSFRSASCNWPTSSRMDIGTRDRSSSSRSTPTSSGCVCPVMSSSSWACYRCFWLSAKAVFRPVQRKAARRECETTHHSKARSSPKWKRAPSEIRIPAR